MKKNFDEWNKHKQARDKEEKKNLPHYHEREIWFCAWGVNIGNEVNGTGDHFDRPVVILKGFSKETFFGVALTGRKKEGKYFYYLGKIHDRDASANLSQVRLHDPRRLVRKIGMLPEETFTELKHRLAQTLFDI